MCTNKLNLLKYEKNCYTHLNCDFTIFRLEVGDSVASSAAVPLGDVLVNYINKTTINGHDCLTVSLWITGIDGTYTFRQL